MLSSLEGAKEVLCIEELSPFIEEQILKLTGKHGLQLKVSGKLDGKVQAGGENSTDKIAAILGDFLGKDFTAEGYDLSDAPALPVRPPVLCAGCPHRASFYAVKQAMKGRKAYFCGDIGCYTLGTQCLLIWLIPVFVWGQASLWHRVLTIRTVTAYASALSVIPRSSHRASRAL